VFFRRVDNRDSGGRRQYVWPAARELIQSIEQGRGSVDGASARAALRSCPIVIAALSPWRRYRPRGAGSGRGAAARYRTSHRRCRGGSPQDPGPLPKLVIVKRRVAAAATGLMLMLTRL